MAELRRARTPTSSVSSDAPRVCSASDRVVSAAHDTLQTALRENPHCSAMPTHTSLSLASTPLCRRAAATYDGYTAVQIKAALKRFKLPFKLWLTRGSFVIMLRNACGLPDLTVDGYQRFVRLQKGGGEDGLLAPFGERAHLLSVGRRAQSHKR